jgi:oligosaccharide translocation protein RFT1
LYYYGLGYVVYSSMISATYYAYFFTRSKDERRRLFVIGSFGDLFIKTTSPFVDHKLLSETMTFLKQGVWMKILTEGERYVMSLCNLVSYKEQGIFDVINSLGSLLPRLVFSTLEESAYTYFQQTLTRTKPGVVVADRATPQSVQDNARLSGTDE